MQKLSNINATQQNALKQYVKRLEPERTDIIPARFKLARACEGVEFMQLFKEEVQYNQTLKVLNDQYFKKAFGGECSLVLADRDYKDI